MLQTDNVTIIGLTGVIALIFAISQLILLRKNGKMIPLWSLGQAFIGLGLIGILALVKDPLPDNWVLAPTAILLGYLVCLAALGKWSGFKLPKKPMLICGGGVVLTAVLFQFSHQVGATIIQIQHHLDIRMGRRKRSHDRHQVKRAERGGRTQTQDALGLPDGLPDSVIHAFNPIQQLAAVFKQGQTRFGQTDAFSCACQQLHAQILLEPGDVLGDVALGHAEPLGST